MKPLKFNVLVKVLDNISEREKKTGILLPDHDNVMPDRGEVVAIGSEVTEVKVGDRVIFDRFRADNKKDRGFKVDNCLVIPEDLILATY